MNLVLTYDKWRGYTSSYDSISNSLYYIFNYLINHRRIKDNLIVQVIPVKLQITIKDNITHYQIYNHLKL